MKHRLLLSALFAGTACVGCIDVNTGLGWDLNPTDQQYDIRTIEIPLGEVSMRFVDDLSGLSSSHITVGAIRDDVYGLTTRSAAFALVPLYDTLDFGTDPVYEGFYFSVAADSVSYADESQQQILQNINVYELESAIDLSGDTGTNTVLAHKGTRITKGVPVYGGSGNLTFEFTEAFGRRYMDILQEDLDTITSFTAKYPGIYLSADPPVGEGGRINMFNVSCLSVYSGSYYLNSNVAELVFSAVYDGERKDTSFVFIFGEAQLYDADKYISSGTRLPQYSFNMTGHETAGQQGPAGADIRIEGGGGLKPVISAEEMRDGVRARILAEGGDPSAAFINKATLVLPFSMPDDYREMDLFPTTLSPTCRLAADDGSYTFAGLTDASNSSENQGDIDRSNLQYAPDITHHMQELLRLADDTKLPNYDIWFLLVREETVENASSSSYDNDYYQQLLYASYYNNLYGYNSYSYGYDSYSNYYNYLMLSQMYANASSSTTTTTSVLDLDCYYRAALHGPGSASERKPVLRVTYALPRE